MSGPMSRREAIAMGLAAGAGLLATPSLRAQAASQSASALPLVTKPIPSSGERLPVVGLGTAQTWGSTPLAQLVTLLRCAATAVWTMKSARLWVWWCRAMATSAKCRFVGGMASSPCNKRNPSNPNPRQTA